MLLQKKNKSIMEIRKKDKKIYERGNCSLKFFLTFLSPKRRKENSLADLQKTSRRNSSVKVSFDTSFWKKGSLAVETAFILPLFFLGMVTLISFMNIYKLQNLKFIF